MASARLEVIEGAHADQKLPTNRSNELMRVIPEARGYLPGGEVHHLDPGDPELFFVRQSH